VNAKGQTIAIALAFALVLGGALWVEYLAPCSWWDGEPVSSMPERCIAP